MAIRARKILENVVYALVAAFNASRKAAVFGAPAADTSTNTTTADAAVTAVADSAVTAVADAAVTALADGSDLATTQALANDLKAKYNASVALTNDIKAKYNAAVALANDIKAKYNLAVALANEQKADFNALRTLVLDMRTKMVSSSSVHYDVTELPIASNDFRNPTQSNMQVTAADGDGTPPTLVALANQCKAFYNLHIADAQAHKVADAANGTAAADATDLATAQTLLNELKGDFNTHVASTTYHPNADSITVSAANATDQASADTLANQIKARINTHITSASTGSTIRLLDP